MGPSKAIGSFHSTCSGPIQAHRQCVSVLARMGPSKAIESFSQNLLWAHSSSSAVFLASYNGPLQVYWKLFSVAAVSPFKLIGSVSVAKMGLTKAIRSFHSTCSGPIQAHWQCISVSRMGPSKAIGSFSQYLQWAHSSSSAVFPASYNRPLQGHLKLFSVPAVGPFKLIGSVSQ